MEGAGTEDGAWWMRERQESEREKVEDGWKILNGEFYQKMMIQENTRTRVARAQAAFRERNREAMDSSTGNNSTKHDLWVDACKVYDFYPRKVGKQAAVRKIAAGIGEFGLEKVLEATKLYAKAWEGAVDLNFCPHPVTWFGQHRFNDDPATWARRQVTSRICSIAAYRCPML